MLFRSSQYRSKICISFIEADWEGGVLDQHWWLVSCLTLPSYPHPLIITDGLISNCARILGFAYQLNLLWCGLLIPPSVVIFLEDCQLTLQFQFWEFFLLIGIRRRIT